MYLGSAVALLSVLHHVSSFPTIIMISRCLKKKNISNKIRENWEMFKRVWSGVTMTFLIHPFTRLMLSSKPQKITFICISAIVPLPYLFLSIFFLQGLVAIRSILTFKKLGTQDDKRNAIKVKICSLCLLYIFPKDPMWRIRLVMVLMMILEYKNAQVFSCFTVSHSLQQSVFFPNFGSLKIKRC